MLVLRLIQFIWKHIFYKKKELQSLGSQIFHTETNAGEYIKKVSTFCGFNETEKIEGIALQLEEDVAILHNGILKSICFCLPSCFLPVEKIGLNFFDSHLQVAYGEKLRAASQKVTELISKRESSFRRYVWTISSLPTLSQHPSYTKAVALNLTNLYFHTETQTTVGLDDQLCFFFRKSRYDSTRSCMGIKRELILDSINSMSEKILHCKNLHQVKKILNLL